jgi:hypothetical protein
MFDATADTGGLCVIPKSHLEHSVFCPRQSSSRMKADFVPIDAKDPILQRSDGVLVGARAGDMILWDSRTIHCNCPALTVESHFANARNKGGDSDHVLPLPETHNDIIRLVSYVCFVPRSMASDSIIRQRKFLFVNKIGTSHWPVNHNEMAHQEVEDLGVHAVVDNPFSLSACSDSQLLLVGFTLEEIKRLRERGEEGVWEVEEGKEESGGRCTIS